MTGCKASALPKMTGGQWDQTGASQDKNAEGNYPVNTVIQLNCGSQNMDKHLVCTPAGWMGDRSASCGEHRRPCKCQHGLPNNGCTKNEDKEWCKSCDGHAKFG